jgi:hypothetical protein
MELRPQLCGWQGLPLDFHVRFIYVTYVKYASHTTRMSIGARTESEHGEGETG